jgi:hypothetical protein
MHGRDQRDVPGEVSFINTQLSGHYDIPLQSVQYSSMMLFLILSHVLYISTVFLLSQGNPMNIPWNLQFKQCRI